MKRYVPAALTLLAFGVGCGGSSSDSSPPPPGSIYVRVAHLSPNAPAVDFCLEPAGGAFTGPVLKGLGLTAGLSYAEVTKYLSLAAGQYTARLVAPNAADCNTSLAGLPDYPLPALSGGTYATAAAVGLVGGTPSFTVKPFVDDSTVPMGMAALRFVHASPGTPAVDVGTLSGSTFAALFSNVSFTNVASGTGIDANGYLQTAPIAAPGVTVAAQVHPSGPVALQIPGVTLSAGQIATAFAIGEIGNATAPLEVLLCGDNATPTGLLSTCAKVP